MRTSKGKLPKRLWALLDWRRAAVLEWRHRH